MEPTAPQVIIGEAEAGRAANVRRAINKLVAATNASTFDLAELLYEAKTKMYFRGWGFDSFSKYAKSLALKISKAYYLVKIMDNMTAAGLTREQFEPVGMTKLRIISRLKHDTEFKGTPMSLLIRELTLKAIGMEPEEVQYEVDALLGLTEDESMVWWNVKLKKLARENVVRPAVEKMKKFLGTQPSEMEEGQHVDASDGRAIEMICADFLADPNYDVPDAPTIADSVQPQQEQPEVAAQEE